MYSCCRVLKDCCRPQEVLVKIIQFQKMHHRQVLHFPLFCPFSISSALSVHFAASPVSAVPSCLSLWLIITDWLLLSPEGGHTVQLTFQAPGPLALPHISPLLLHWRDTRGPVLHLKRWASSCVLIPQHFFLWCLEIVFFRKEGEQLQGHTKVGEAHRYLVSFINWQHNESRFWERFVYLAKLKFSNLQN